MQKSATASVQEPVQQPWQSASTSVADYPTGYPTSHHSNFDEEAPRSAFSVVEPPAELSTLTTHLTGHSTEDTFPDGGLQAWCVVAGSFCLLMGTFGVMNTTGILQNYFATHQLASYSPSAVGWIPGLFTFFGLSISVQVGPMFDRYGPRGILIAGTICYVTGLLLLAESHLYWHFVLTLGVLSGTGAALLSTVALASVPQWFDRKAALAIGISMSGAGLGGVIFPFVLRSGFTNLGYKWTIRLLALLVLILALELEVFAGLGLYPTYVIMQGFSTNTSVVLLAVQNVASTIGRLVAGGVADRFGRINTQTGLIALGAFAVFVIWLPFGNSLIGLYMFSVIFGLASGSFLSLAPACIGQISRASEVGGRFGLTYSIVSFATLICIPIGGEMLDKVGKQAMVAYLGSVLIVSLGLFVMARWACLSYRWRWQAKI
ncbi:Major facilitator superfamily domain general substrate transporter [Penicillium expansum]|nr:Major facilitator superfamily domain general substrate transporter [Penicillium expansum]